MPNAWAWLQARYLPTDYNTHALMNDCATQGTQDCTVHGKTVEACVYLAIRHHSLVKSSFWLQDKGCDT